MTLCVLRIPSLKERCSSSLCWNTQSSFNQVSCTTNSSLTEPAWSWAQIAGVFTWIYGPSALHHICAIASCSSWGTAVQTAIRPALWRCSLSLVKWKALSLDHQLLQNTKTCTLRWEPLDLRFLRSLAVSKGKPIFSLWQCWAAALRFLQRAQHHLSRYLRGTCLQPLWSNTAQVLTQDIAQKRVLLPDLLTGTSIPSHRRTVCCLRYVSYADHFFAFPLNCCAYFVAMQHYKD